VDTFPVGDVRVSGVFSIDPRPDDALQVRLIIETRGQQHIAELTRSPAEPELVFASLEIAAANRGRERVAAAVINNRRAFSSRAMTTMSFELVDQSLRLRIEGESVLSHDIEQDPLQRLVSSTELTEQQIADPAQAFRLARPASYDKVDPKIGILIEGASSATIANLNLDRDIHYQPVGDRAVSPGALARLLQDQFFALGDNASSSEDSRDWRDYDPVLSRSLRDTTGVIARDLLLGRAVFVYFPSPIPANDHDSAPMGVPMLDLGRIRTIR